MTETAKLAPEFGTGAAQEKLTVAQAAELLGLSAHTIRYYERAGLIAVPRDSAGNRAYGDKELRRLEFLRRMRASGMPMSTLGHYIDLVDEGEDTIPARLALMHTHRDRIAGQLRELRAALAATDYKIATYGGTLDGQCDTAAAPNIDDFLPDLDNLFRENK